MPPLPTAMIQAANAALLERPAFAIDDAGDEDEDDLDDGDVGEDDDQVMDEVRNDTALGSKFEVYVIDCCLGRCLFGGS